MKPYTLYVERPKTRHYNGVDLEDIHTHALPSKWGSNKWGTARSPMRSNHKRKTRLALTKMARNKGERGWKDDLNQY